LAAILRRLAACAALALAFPRTAAAEWHFTPMVGTTFLGETSLLNSDLAAGNVHRNFGGSVALLGSGVVGVEGLFVWTPGFFTGRPEGLVKRSRSIAAMGNVMVTTPRRWTEYSLRPFISGGLGVIRTSRTEDVFPDNRNIPAFNIGGGAIGFLSNRTGLRFDLRYNSSLARSDAGGEPIGFGRVHIRYMTASVGLVLRR
jgi:hypothetical protein